MKGIPAAEHLARATHLEVVTRADNEALPKGICGTITGVALVYNEKDAYDTMFAPGCLSRTIAEQVDKRKVKLFLDHGPFVETHVGTIASIKDIGDTAVMTADLFDTDAGRAAKEYVEAVLDSKSETGLSIGFRAVEREWTKDGMGNLDTLVFKEVALREISITPVPAVPGTGITAVRAEDEKSADDQGLLVRTLRTILKALPESMARAEYDSAYAPSAATTDPKAAPTPEASASSSGSGDDADRRRPATDEERAAVLRATFDLSITG